MRKEYLAMACFAICLCTSCLPAKQEAPSLDGFKDGIHHWNLEHKERNYQRYTADDFEDIADNLLAYQNPDGGWPKNVDWLAILPTDSVKNALKEKYKRSTLDNRNTFPQIIYLADVYRRTKTEKYKTGVLKGLNYLLGTQKANGGWRGWDVDAITFNDEVTTGALELFLLIKQGDRRFEWLSKEDRERIEEALQRGIELILKCQVIQDGVKTAWGQQHDNETFVPVKARSYELEGLTANESCSILQLLMSIEQPTDEIIESVKSAIVWLEKVKINGLRIERVPIPEDKIINHEYPYENVAVADSTAKPIWARYYEVADNTPFLCRRDGRKVWQLADVDPERRVGYEWYGYWPEKVFEKYPAWLERVEAANKGG